MKHFALLLLSVMMIPCATAGSGINFLLFDDNYQPVEIIDNHVVTSGPAVLSVQGITSDTPPVEFYWSRPDGMELYFEEKSPPYYMGFQEFGLGRHEVEFSTSLSSDWLILDIREPSPTPTPTPRPTPTPHPHIPDECPCAADLRTIIDLLVQIERNTRPTDEFTRIINQWPE